MLGHRKPDRVLCVKLAKLCISQPKVYLDYIPDTTCENVFKIPLDTLLFLFIATYEDICANIDVTLVPIEDEVQLKKCPYFELEACFFDKFNNFSVAKKVSSILESIQCVKRPSVYIEEETRIISGLCASIRFNLLHFNKRVLLGFRSSCLNCCAQASLWTKFCERDVPSELNNLNTAEWRLNPENRQFPPTLLLLENQLLQPVRTHNMSLVKKRLKQTSLEHIFVEGVEMTLADMLIFLCVHLMFKEMAFADFSRTIPNVKIWYKRMIEVVKERDVKMFLNQKMQCNRKSALHVADDVTPIVFGELPLPTVCLYSQSKLNAVEKIDIKHKDSFPTLYLLERKYPSRRVENETFHKDLPWDEFPQLVRPESGGLPHDRIIRKRQQISNIVNAVCSLVHRDGLKIVDFCSGGGHVGIVLSYLLPNCTICFVENKFESLFNAQKRAKELNLKNVQFFQCNLDCFIGKFDIGVSLHACGGATDMVIDKCVRSRASFVSIPCCYGAIGSDEPRHSALKQILEAIEDKNVYQDLCHFADRNISRDGEHAMDAVDTDRLMAVEATGNYEGILTKILPVECTPKNNMIVATAVVH